MKRLAFSTFAIFLSAPAFASTLVCFQVQNQRRAVDLFNAPTIQYQIFDTSTKNQVLDLSLTRLSQNPGEFNQMEVEYGINQMQVLSMIFTLDSSSGKYLPSYLDTQVPVVNLVANPSESAARNASCFNLLDQ